MRRGHLEAFAPICPVCATSGVQSPLRLEHVVREDGEHVVEGLLGCASPTCLREYPILDGIPLLVADLRGHVGANPLAFLERDDLSPVLESVLADCAGAGSPWDQLRARRASYLHAHWVAPEGFLGLLGTGARLAPPRGLALDVGCAVGRGTFALAEAGAERVLGIDLDFSMLRFAARALRTGRLRVGVRRVGLVYDPRDLALDLPGADRVDFWMADALALPFVAASVDHVSSMNLLDCLQSPAAHVASVAALLRPGGTALFATPHDWSAYTPIEGWIGGHSQRGPDRGASEPRLRALLAESGLRLTGEADADWLLRLHDRAEMRYRVQLVSAATPA